MLLWIFLCLMLAAILLPIDLPKDDDNDQSIH